MTSNTSVSCLPGGGFAADKVSQKVDALMVVSNQTVISQNSGTRE
jgi:hypothetical protein